MLLSSTCIGCSNNFRIMEYPSHLLSRHMYLIVFCSKIRGSASTQQFFDGIRKHFHKVTNGDALFELVQRDCDRLLVQKRPTFTRLKQKVLQILKSHDQLMDAGGGFGPRGVDAELVNDDVAQLIIKEWPARFTTSRASQSEANLIGLSLPAAGDTA